MSKQLRDYGVVIGGGQPGPNNSITDVPGVLVGHCTISNGSVQTGVTAILPHPGDIFHDKVMAAVHVINGFAKACGLIQIQELGTIETPIMLTNTLSVGAVASELISYLLEKNPDIGLTTGTVNPVVLECNDGFLNTIREQTISGEHVRQALDNASQDCSEGAIGAGAGMSCFGLKGGIGTSSRHIELDSGCHTLGVLTLTNFGHLADLMIDGRQIGKRLDSHVRENEQGSVITVVATDMPLSERQLGRVARRAAVGLARTGSFIGGGSGEITLAFSTANRVSHYPTGNYQNITILQENNLDKAFRAVIEATEEAVLNSMLAAETTVGRDGHIRYSLASLLEQISLTI